MRFGGGRVLRHLHTHGYDVHGIEYDDLIVSKIKEADSSLKAYKGDILNMQFDEDTFDVSLCFGIVGTFQRDMAKAIFELKRVTKGNGIILISVLLDNLARRMQKTMNSLSPERNNFYAWLNSRAGWCNYLESFGLEIIDSRVIVSRYNLYYWAGFLRSAAESNLNLARVKEDEYKLNWLGECLWSLHKNVFREQLAGGVTYAVRNRK